MNCYLPLTWLVDIFLFILLTVNMVASGDGYNLERTHIHYIVIAHTEMKVYSTQSYCTYSGALCLDPHVHYLCGYICGKKDGMGV